ncbi:MAG: hypothetical protein KGK03_01690 [Candidatus Omnitrophica bacterium]|nr:hypothetical protein [Candidatus Omnitrophota bacterium]
MARWAKAVLVLCVLWWVYLFFVTQIVVVFDSTGYESAGRLIAQHGFAEFLREGPQREPMFACLIALSMHLGHWWGISYYYPLKMIGILFLFLTMVFSYQLMKLLSIRPWLAALTLLYMGLSPVMTNSSMRLWSEFAAYPWVVLAVLWTIKSWKALEDAAPEGREDFKMVRHGALVALAFLLIMSVKAVAEGVILCYLWPFYGRIFSYWRQKNFIKARQAALFVLTALMIFEGAVVAYKWANYHYNRQFTFTTRGDYAFYGNTARRMQPLTAKSLGAAVTFVAGGNLCPSLFGQEACDFWSARHSDDIIGQKQKELAQKKLTADEASRYYIKNSIQIILSNPLQALLLMVVEAHKMFFWESAIAFVAYPDWLEKIFYNPSFIALTKNVMAFLSWSAMLFGLIYLCRPRRQEEDRGQREALLWVVNFLFWYMGMYSLFFILDRYSFPLISLYLVLVAFMVQKTLKAFVK